MTGYYTKNELKPSGIEWLGDIPKHWEVKKLKYVARVQSSNVDKKSIEGEDPVLLCNYTDVYNHEFINSSFPFMEASAKPDEKKKFLVHKDDVLITKDSETPDDIANPAYIVENLPNTLCGYHLAQIRSNKTELNGKYLFRFFQDQSCRAYYEVAANGITRYGLGIDSIKGMKVPLPPLPEQQAIALYLDGKCGEIDKLIANKQRIIALLQEERAAMINQAVIRGLNPQAKLKPSGIEWIGDVPEGWDVKPLYSRYELNLGKMLDEKRITGQYLVPYLRNIDVQWDKINIDDLPKMDICPNEYKRCTLQRGDLVVCEGGEIGRAAIWNGELELCGFQKALHRLRPLSSKEHTRFLFYTICTASQRGIFESKSNQSTILHLTGEAFRKYRFPTPPIEEQQEIVEYIDQETARIDGVLSRTKREIELLQEYRTALISEVVTGKVRVSQEVNEGKPAPKTGGNARIRRAVLAAEVVQRFHKHQTFGRVKLMKCLYLLENHLQITELDMEWSRQLAGPYSPKGIGSAEKTMKDNQWFGSRKTTGNSIMYFQLPKSGGHKKYFPAWFGDRQSEIDQLLDLLSPLDMDQCEIVATLYGAWNDLIIQNENITDDRIVDEVRNHWHDTKKRFEPERLKKALGWMRKKAIVPTGWGKPLMIPDKKKQK